MPVNYHHYHYKDFKSHVFQVLPEAAKKLSELEARELELRKQADALHALREKVSNELLNEHYQLLRPLMRPCHQSRFDARARFVEIEPRGFLF